MSAALKSTFPSYQPVARTRNSMINLNPLKQTTAQVVGLDNRLKQLDNCYRWGSVMRLYDQKGIKWDISMLPRVAMVELGKIMIDEDIQRDLDPYHVADIADPDNFDPRLLQTIFCAKMPGKDEFHAVDGQHTATVIAALARAGLFVGVTDWTKIPVAVAYIETSDKSFARMAFALINGQGKKPISKWDDHRMRVQSVRIDGSNLPIYVTAERKQTICEANHCWPVDKANTFLKSFPGTFTHMEALNLDDNTLAVTCAWHNRFFHYQIIDGSLWFAIPEIVKTFREFGLDFDSDFQEELAAIVQTLFGGMKQFHSMVKTAHALYCMQRYGYRQSKDVKWDSHSLAASLIQIYKRMGGTNQVAPALLHQCDGITNFFPPAIRQWYVN